MCEHRYPCVLCAEQTATDPEWPCADCVATELALEDDFAREPDPDIEREVARLDDLSVEERAEYEDWSDAQGAGDAT